MKAIVNNSLKMGVSALAALLVTAVLTSLVGGSTGLANLPHHPHAGFERMASPAAAKHLPRFG